MVGKVRRNNWISLKCFEKFSTLADLFETIYIVDYILRYQKRDIVDVKFGYDLLFVNRIRIKKERKNKIKYLLTACTAKLSFIDK